MHFAQDIIGDKVDKNKRKNLKNSNKVNNLKDAKENKDKIDYDYNFIPNLNEWLNIDEQKEKAQELEDI